MKKIYEMTERHKKELIDKFIYPYTPYINSKTPGNDLILCDNSLNDPMYRVDKIFRENEDLVVNLTALSEWSYGEVITMDLMNLEYEHLVTIAEFFN